MTTIDSTTTPSPPPVAALKDQARRLRRRLAEGAVQAISHAQALELIAAQYGYRDWNTLSAVAPKQPAASGDETAPFQVGRRVAGRYLDHAFEGRMVGVQAMGPRHYRVTVQFDAPIDVVDSPAFSVMRRRVTAVVDRAGVSPARISNGAPQLALAA